MSMDMRMERRVPTPMRSVRRFGVRSEHVYFSRGMGYRQSSSRCAYRIDVSRHQYAKQKDLLLRALQERTVPH